nr:uncharacterized protein LOC123763629 isoform X1 [Procambarus clarkii]
MIHRATTMMILLALLLTSELLTTAMAQELNLDAEDCVVYDEKNSEEPHVKEFEERVSTAVTPQTNIMSMKLHLVSASHNCTIFFVVRSLLSECTNGRTTKLLNWPIELFRQYDTTEIWIQLAVSDGVSKAESNSDDASLAGSYMNNVTLAGSLYDLFLVGKRGKLQGRLVIPGSGLTPPVRMHWVTVEEAKHYFNCVTGCLLSRAAKTQSGDHSIFLRQGEGPLHLTLTYTGGSRGGHHTANLTSADLGPPARLRNITLVWDGQLGTIGVLVDGAPVGGLVKYSILDHNRGVEAEVTDGNGLVSACDPRFQGVARYFPPDLSLPSPDSSNSSSSCQTMIWLLALIFLICLATTALFAALYYQASRRLLQLQRPSANSRTSTNSRTSSKRTSDRRKDLTVTDSPNEKEDCNSASEVTMSVSMKTPEATPGSVTGPRSPKFVSTKDFVDLNLM